MITGFSFSKQFEIEAPTTSDVVPSSQSRPHSLAQLIHHQEGASILEVALLMPLLLLVLVGAVDYGRGYYAAIEVSSAAESGALYGTLNPTDTTGMIAMAKMNAKDVSTINATAIYGCECSDGSTFVLNCSINITCSTNVVKYVEVSTSANYTPMLPYPGIGSSLSLSNKVRLRTSY